MTLVFANEAELLSLYQTASFESALAAISGDVGRAVITRSEKGCVVVDRGAVGHFPAVPVDRVVDLTGAGDLFAAGFLHGLARNAPMRECAHFGAIAAAEVIRHIGARPQTRLSALAVSRGLAA